MSSDTGRVTISRFSFVPEEQKQVLQETIILCVLEMNWLAARDTPFSSSKTTCVCFRLLGKTKLKTFVAELSESVVLKIGKFVTKIFFLR